MTVTVKPKRKLLGTLAFSQAVNEYQLFSSEREQDIRSKMMLHASGDWGDLEPEDAKTNNEVVRQSNGGRLHSVYKLQDNKTIWIITSGYGLTKDDMDLTQFSEQDYCNTVVLFPEEY
tara:strand:- start:1252 stop:1605 length:354 start_codon:yes stop_codon:yes gene_type:complete